MTTKPVQWAKKNWDLALLVSLAAGFAAVAGTRLGTYPVYETDESYILQVAYEILHRGKLALPMYRFLGGNIENVWHSFTPLYFFSLSGFLKVFGFGVLQGRVFNLIAAVCCLAMVYLVGRRLFNWRVGFIAAVMIVSDPTVLQRARMIRNDYLAEAFALLAFYLYEVAQERKSARYFVASGLAAGAGIMCHPSILYMVIATGLLMLIRRGWSLFREKSFYQYAAAVLSVCLYEIVYDAIDYKNLLLQYQGDNLHFGILSVAGLWSNLLEEPTRYLRWYRIYDVTFQTVPLTLLHLSQLLAAIAVVYLAIRAFKGFRLGRGIDEPRVRLLLVALVAMLFLAFILHKAGYYNIHVITWLSLCAGVFLSDAFDAIRQSPALEKGRPAGLRAITAACIVSLMAAYGALLVRQYQHYLVEARSPDTASSVEIKTVLADAVPPGLCPVAVMAPVLWLSFPDRDQCFATLERRMTEAFGKDSNEYALIMRPKASDHWAWDLSANRHLLAELFETPYGNFNIYYTGTDRAYVDLPARRFYFFRQWNGHATQEQVDAAPVVWSAGLNNSPDPPANQRGSDGQSHSPHSDKPASALPLELQLQPKAIYSIRLTAPASFSGSEVLIVEAATGRWLKQIPFVEEAGASVAADVFRTLQDGRITLQPYWPASQSVDAVQVALVSATIRKVADVAGPNQADGTAKNRQPQSGTTLTNGR